MLSCSFHSSSTLFLTIMLIISHLQFVGNWESLKKYPIPVAEAQGAMIGNDFILFSGFTNGYGQCTTKNYALDITDANADWRELADFPIAKGVTHSANVVVGKKFYMCGGVRMSPSRLSCLIGKIVYC